MTDFKSLLFKEILGKMIDYSQEHKEGTELHKLPSGISAYVGKDPADRRIYLPVGPGTWAEIPHEDAIRLSGLICTEPKPAGCADGCPPKEGENEQPTPKEPIKRTAYEWWEMGHRPLNECAEVVKYLTLYCHAKSHSERAIVNAIETECPGYFHPITLKQYKLL